jgi:hypothetical protein
MQHFADVRLHFPNFDDPDCLVVTGLERVLNPRQKTVLRDANRHRHRLRIIGFDWLAYGRNQHHAPPRRSRGSPRKLTHSDDQ